MTITVFSFDKNNNIMFSGKHEDIMLFESESNCVKEIETEGILISRLQFEKTDINHEIQPKKGDILLLYTDGLIECWKKEFSNTERSENMFGTEHLKKLFFENSKKSPEEI